MLLLQSLFIKSLSNIYPIRHSRRCRCSLYLELNFNHFLQWFYLFISYTIIILTIKKQITLSESLGLNAFSVFLTESFFRKVVMVHFLSQRSNPCFNFIKCHIQCLIKSVHSSNSNLHLFRKCCVCCVIEIK